MSVRRSRVFFDRMGPAARAAAFVGGCMLVLGVVSTKGVAQQYFEPPCQAILNPDPWSLPGTWGGTKPGPGDDVLIPYGQTILLDEDALGLGTVTIRGHLVFDRANVTLEADAIHVKGTGTLRVGTDCHPFLQQATIRLTAPDCADPEARAIRVEDGGRLDLIGKPYSDSWVELDMPADAFQPDLVLKKAIDWPANSEIVVASTDFDMNHAERRTIQSVNNKTITVTTDLQRKHHAGNVGTDPFTVPVFAEVGLLSRTIVVEGTPVDCVDPSGPDDTYAGHVIFLKTQPSEPPPVGRLLWTEFRFLGNEGELGDYPIHFHKIGNLNKSRVEGCSVHQCYNRVIAVHNSQNLDVVDTVGYDSIGHMFYMEEDDPPDPGPVTGCLWEGNLGLVARNAEVISGVGDNKVVPTDDRASVYWLEGLENVVIDNHAAGADGMGFWMDVTNEPHYAGYPMGMAGNVSHSNGENGFYHNERPWLMLDPTGTPYLEDLVAYKNREYGVWVRAYNVAVLENIRVADNLTGAYLSSAGESSTIPDPSIQRFLNSTVVGESPQNTGSERAGDPGWTSLEDNHGRSLPFDVPWTGNPPVSPPLRPLSGVIVYDGLMSAEGTHFSHFTDLDYTCINNPGLSTCNDNHQRFSGAFTPVQSLSPWAVDTRGFARANSFGPGVRRVRMRPLFPDQNGIWNTVLFDVRGELIADLVTLFGSPCTANSGPTYFVPNNLFLAPASSSSSPLCLDGDLNGAVWSPGPGEGYAQLEIQDLLPHGSMAPTHARYWRNNAAGLEASFLAIDPTGSTKHAFATNFPVGTNVVHNLVSVEWDRIVGGTSVMTDVPDFLSVQLHFGRIGSVVLVGLPWDGVNAPTVSYDAAGTQTLPGFVDNIGAFLTAPGDAWLHMTDESLLPPVPEQADQSVYLKLVVDDDGDDDITAALEDPVDGAPVDPVLEEFYDGEMIVVFVQDLGP